MLTSADSIKSVLVFFGPMILSTGWSWYKSAKARQRTQKQPIKPLTQRLRIAIALLIGAAALFAFYTTPILAPENIFAVTRSQPGTSVELLTKRLGTLRPVTPADDLVLAKFANKASRLLYYKHGPAVLAACPFCTSQDPTTYLLYAAPALALPHLLNAALVGLATSDPVAGRAGPPWRGRATYAAAAILAVDAYMLATWDPAANEAARVLAEVVFFHWSARAYRFLALAALDLALAAALYLSATNRLFGVPLTLAEQIDTTTYQLAQRVARVQSANVLKNTVSRDAELRAVHAQHWANMDKDIQEIFEDEDVMNAIRTSVENGKLDLDSMNAAAGEYSRQALGTP